MKEHTLLLLCLTAIPPIYAQVFAEYFADKTFRADHIFNDNASQQDIRLDGLSSLPTRAGGKRHLVELSSQGNGQIVMRDAASGKIIYTISLSSLFQEWLETDETKSVTKGFENTFLLPHSLQSVEIEIILLDSRRSIRVSMRHIAHPDNVLITQKGNSHITPYKYLLQNGDADKCIDVAILVEEYIPQKAQTLYKDAGVTCESLFAYELLKSMKKRFNIVVVISPSIDSGVNVPRLNERKRTAPSSHFSTFYSDRYLTTSCVRAIHDALAGIPYKHTIILANTEEYGGGGIYNSHALTTAHHTIFRPVAVREFGHSFGGLVDEYFHDNDIMTDTYSSDIGPWEQNISTQVGFAPEWKDTLPSNIPVPAPISASKRYPTGVYEGRGYSVKGIFRPVDNCRMCTNEYSGFCPVCQRTLRRIINFYTE